jgi:hypothetical protein
LLCNLLLPVTWLGWQLVHLSSGSSSGA